MPRPHLSDTELTQLQESWCRTPQETQKMANNTTTQVINMYKDIFERWSNAYGDKNNLEQQVLKRYSAPLISFCEKLIHNVLDWSEVSKLCKDCGHRHAKYVPFHTLTNTDFSSVGMVLASSIREIIAERKEEGINATKLGDNWLVLLQAVVEELSAAYEVEFEKHRASEDVDKSGSLSKSLSKRQMSKRGRLESHKELPTQASMESLKHKGAVWCSLL